MHNFPCRIDVFGIGYALQMIRPGSKMRFFKVSDSFWISVTSRGRKIPSDLLMICLGGRISPLHLIDSMLLCFCSWPIIGFSWPKNLCSHFDQTIMNLFTILAKSLTSDIVGIIVFFWNLSYRIDICLKFSDNINQIYHNTICPKFSEFRNCRFILQLCTLYDCHWSTSFYQFLCTNRVSKHEHFLGLIEPEN